ncbi:MAG: PIN domain-containing protein [Verrucomicrobia bacterium]|nr:PIN domain-containing protein [Verrucomicrobiota bacterium]
MICLDANFLIGGVIEARPESRHLLAWVAAGETFCTAAPAWYEFLCGPVTAAQIDTMMAFLKGGIIPFAAAQAQVAALLFNAADRPRRLRVDAMIAAAAISQQVPLATLNTADFKPFTSHGLLLAIPLEP